MKTVQKIILSTLISIAALSVINNAQASGDSANYGCQISSDLMTANYPMVNYVNPLSIPLAYWVHKAIGTDKWADVRMYTGTTDTRFASIHFTDVLINLPPKATGYVLQDTEGNDDNYFTLSALNVSPSESAYGQSYVQIDYKSGTGGTSWMQKYDRNDGSNNGWYNFGIASFSIGSDSSWSNWSQAWGNKMAIARATGAYQRNNSYYIMWPGYVSSDAPDGYTYNTIDTLLQKGGYYTGSGSNITYQCTPPLETVSNYDTDNAMDKNVNPLVRIMSVNNAGIAINMAQGQPLLLM
ncbi:MULTISPECIES: hypothetical protein [Cysteiniphilum]|uniref:Uncharacterized protein n=1 Tax=Cysteiniphilum litorale TaxID=2056700 RepID=A0A8J2Z766_9GAMM|nr:MULTISPECIES: hypothetical protein [Cysteiniphilum]GGG08636.1 hypothetical protein GCM10010995_27730 [Cysteiniphilum litorale]